MKTLDLLTAEGKPLSKSFIKTLAKLIANGKLTSEYNRDDKATRTNPFSGVSVEIPLVAALLADWICSPNLVDATGKFHKPFTRSDWDNARYTFAVCWPEQYYDLID